MNEFQRFERYVTGGIILLFGLAALSRILDDKQSPSLISGGFGALSTLASKTING